MLTLIWLSDQLLLQLLVPLGKPFYSKTDRFRQRCTTTRRLFVQEGIHDEFIKRLISAYKQIRIGDPLLGISNNLSFNLKDDTLCGPLHSPDGVKLYQDAINNIKAEGGVILYGDKVLSDRPGNYVMPTITSIPHSASVVQDEVFVPILHTFKFKVCIVLNGCYIYRRWKKRLR